jgi:outer membrane protein, multidrug efflux system
VVAAEVVLAYTDLRGAQARLAVARDNVANQESASELTQQLLTAGRGTQLDVDRSVALLESTRASIPPLIAAESAAIYRLGVLVGSEPQALAADLRRPDVLPRRPIRSGSASRSACCGDGRTWPQQKRLCSRRRRAPVLRPPSSSQSWC